MAETKTDAPKKPRARRSARSRAVEEVARSYFAAVTARDPDAMAGHWAADGIEDIVPLGVFRGPGAVRALFTEIFAAFPNLDMQVTRVIADDRTAVVEYRMRGDFTGAPFQGVEATGRHIEIRGADLLDIPEDRIVRNTAFYDGAEFARQIGLLPPQDSGPERAMRGAFNTVTRARRAWAERGS